MDTWFSETEEEEVWGVWGKKRQKCRKKKGGPSEPGPL